MEADCYIFLIKLKYRFFGFDVPSISLDILSILISMSLSLSEKLDIKIANAVYLVFHITNLV